VEDFHRRKLLQGDSPTFAWSALNSLFFQIAHFLLPHYLGEGLVRILDRFAEQHQTAYYIWKINEQNKKEKKNKFRFLKTFFKGKNIFL